MRGEALGQGDLALQSGNRTDARHEPIDPGSGRTQSCEHAAARWIAQRSLTVRVGEESAARSEPVDVWRFGLGMSTKAADPIIQVINGDEKNVRSRGDR